MGGMIAALSIVCMFLTGLIPFATYALPAIAGVLLVAVVIELGKRWAWLVYIAVSLLSLFLAPDAEAKVLFILFFGYYPILKASFESLRPKWLSVVLKFAVFNVAVVLSYLIALRFLGIPAEDFELFGYNIPLVLLVLGNLVFLLYDYAVGCVAAAYVRRLQPVLHRRFHG